MNQYVRSFQVPVDDAKLVQLFKSFDDLPNDIEGHFFIDFFVHAEAFKVSAWAVLHDEIDIVLGVYDLIEFDNVGMFQFLHDCNLVVQRLFQVTIAADEFLFDSLDGYLAAFIADRLVDLSEGAFAQAVPLVDCVIFYFLYYVHLFFFEFM